MGKIETTNCPICKTQCQGDELNHRDASWYECPNCGSYEISRSALFCLEKLCDKARAVLSHGIWSGQEANAPFQVTTVVLEAAEREKLPNPSEQLDRFILYLGEHQESPSERFSWPIGTLRAKIGAVKPSDEWFVAQAAAESGLVDTSASSLQGEKIRLTMAGWERFHELQRGAVTSRTAFMAMPFGNASLTPIVDEVFRPAVQETGFTLRRVDDEPQAGLIDNKIRVDIRLSRFLIADLTGGNLGAYWEAGYAEGLGKPVLYTCSKAHFKEHQTHFDANHCTTVLWDPDNLAKTAEDLKATIRATLPFEAMMPKED